MSKVLASKLNYNGPRQIYAPNPFIVATSQGTGDQGFKTIRIKMPVPDSRTRVKLTLMFVPTAGVANPNLNATGQTIWVAGYDEDSRGGGAGRTIPVTDIEGTSSGPTAFPVSSGLLGYSREFVTSADWIEAVVVLVSVAVVGAWVVQTQIQPDAVSFSWEEWDQIRRDFVPMNADQMARL